MIIVGLGVVGAVLGHVLGFAISTMIAVFMLYLGPYRALYTSSLLLLLVEQYRLILLAYNVSDLEIGNFQAAGNFATLLVIISTPISMALFPAFSKLDPSGEDVRKAFQYSVKYTAVLTVPAALFTMLMSRSPVEIVYGSKYLLAPLFLSLYTAVYLCSAFGSTVLDKFFSAIGKTA